MTDPPRVASFEEVWAERKDEVAKIACAVTRYRGNRDLIAVLISAGQVALWQSLERYDPSRGLFWPWAQARVRGAMLDELREADTLSRYDRERVKRGEEIPPWAFAHPCDVDLVRDLPIEGDPEASLQEAESRTVLSRKLELLPDRLRYVVERTLLHGDKLTEVAAVLGVTESRACQLRGKALSMLREDHVVYCEFCRKKRFDGPQNCPTCGARLRHLLPGEDVPAESHAPWTETKSTVNRGEIAAPKREYEEARESGERVPDEYVGHIEESNEEDEEDDEGSDDAEKADEEIEEATNPADETAGSGAPLGEGVQKAHKGRKLVYLITYQGKTQGTSAWVRELGINRITVTNRIRRGMSAADVLSTTNYKRASARKSPADLDLPAREQEVTALAVVPPGRTELTRPAPGGAEEAGDEVVNQVQALFDRLDEIEAARMPHRTRRDELMTEINLAYDQVASLEKQVAELDAVLAPLDSERNAILTRMRRACDVAARSTAGSATTATSADSAS